MIRSMTGYGRKDVGDAESRFTIEVRSLNNRYLDIQVKTPRSLTVLESGIKKAVQDRFSRGRFDVFISRNGDREKNGKLTVDEALVSQYIGILRDLKTRFELAGDVEVTTIAGLHNLVTFTEEKEDEAALWQVLSQGLTLALDELDSMRSEEGMALVQDIRARLTVVEKAIQTVRSQAPATVESARNRMTDTLNKLLNAQPDPIRLAQEIAILAERTDVTEELTRLSSHMGQFNALLQGTVQEAIGRKLDFLLQEMGREVNTIASKANDAKISLEVVHVKAELEKIREQVQNIE